MPATPLAERPTSLKLLGAALVALMLFFVWLTYAFFNKTFVDAEIVTLETTQAGSNLPKNADVKLRGMIVGEVRDIKPQGEAVEITLAMKPDMIGRIPAGVTAQILPKTLFGEKYIALIAPEGAGPDDESLKAGDTIEKAVVPIEVEKLLNDLYPLLQAVEPAELSYTLTAVSQALEGRGEKLGSTLVTLNDYLQELNPEVPQLVDDLVKLGDVSDGYADAMPEVGRILRNTVVTGNTVVAKRTQLAAFFDEGTRLANSLTEFTEANGDNLEGLAKDGRVILGVTAKYSPTIPCFLKGMVRLLPRLDSLLRNRTVHIDLELLPEQPSGYSESENASVPRQSVLDSTPAAQPVGPGDGEGTIEEVCRRLPEYKSNGAGGTDLDRDKVNPYSQGDPYPGPDPEVYGLVGLENSHNGKFGTDADFDRAAVASLEEAGFFSPSLVDVETDQQRADLGAMAAAVAGVDPADVPDLAGLMLGPIVRGAEVSAR